MLATRMRQAAAGVGGITYLLRDEFTTDAAAPLASPRTCEPGPGTLVVNVPTQMSISGGKLVASAGASANHGVIDSDARSHVGGRAALVKVDSASGRCDLQFGPSGGNPNIEIPSGANPVYVRVPAGTASDTGLVGGTFPSVAAIVWREDGGSYWIFNGKLAWTDPSVSTGARKVKPTTTLSSWSWQVDYLKVVDIPAPWSTTYGIADVHATPAVSGTDYTGQANAIIDQVVTAPASLAGEAGYWFRKQDASNGYKAYFDSAGAFKVDRYVAGTPTNVVSVAGVITGSGTRTIRTIADGTSLRFYTLSGTTWTQRGGTITDSSFSAQTTITPFADGSWTGGGGSIGQLDSWPRTLSGAALAALNAV